MGAFQLRLLSRLPFVILIAIFVRLTGKIKNINGGAWALAKWLGFDIDPYAVRGIRMMAIRDESTTRFPVKIS